MGQLTVRNVDDEVIRKLKIRAAENRRSAEAEHREILRQALMPERKISADEWWQKAKELRERLGPMPDDSTDIIRKFRDERTLRRRRERRSQVVVRGRGQRARGIAA